MKRSKDNAESRWNFTFDRDVRHDHVRTLIENEINAILIVERYGVPTGGAIETLGMLSIFAGDKELASDRGSWWSGLVLSGIR